MREKKLKYDYSRLSTKKIDDLTGESIKISPKTLERIDRRCIEWGMTRKEVVIKLLDTTIPKPKKVAKACKPVTVNIGVEAHKKLATLQRGTGLTYSDVLEKLMNGGRKTEYEED